MVKRARKLEKAGMKKEKKENLAKEEHKMLNAQKDVVIDMIKRAGIYERSTEIVRDDDYNAKLLHRISSVESKIDSLDLMFTQLLSRGRFVGREQEVLPKISSVLQLIVQLFMKVNLEAFRIGVLNK